MPSGSTKPPSCRSSEQSLDETVEVMQRWRERIDAHDGPGDDLDLDIEIPGRLHLSDGLDGRGVLDGDTDTNQLLKTALRVADSNELDVAPDMRRAEALGVIAKFFLDNQQTHTGGRPTSGT